ncbi:chromatin-remodeling protein SWR1 ASCRUDRAFT_18658, partial [Ascoidea rubescens DSM 1968]
KIKFIFNPKPPLLNPSQRIPPPKFSQFEHYLNSFKSLDNDVSIDTFNDIVQKDSLLLTKIKHGLTNNILKLNDSKEIIKIPKEKPYQDPIKYSQIVHSDHLLAHAIKLSKIHNDLRKNHILKCKKIASMIQIHFNRLKKLKKNEYQQELKRRQTLAKFVMRLVKSYWKKAEKAHQIQLNAKQKEIQMEKSNINMTKMVLESHKKKHIPTKTLTIIDSNNNTLKLLNNKFPNQNQNDNYTDDDDDDDDNFDQNNNLQSLYSEQDLLPSSPFPDTYLNTNKLHYSEEQRKLIEETDKQPYDSLLDSDDESLSEESLSESDHLSASSQPESDGYNLFNLLQSDPSDTNDSSNETISENKQIVKNNNLTTLTHTDNQNNSKINNKINEKINEDSQPSIPDVPTPMLLKGTLREYQKQGLNWLASLYNTNTNGILADEMGLGKTIQTISLICYLACEKHIWGPHLIIVPTSVMLNWEMEFKRFAPGFKVLTYYGNPQQRKDKRKGWNKLNAFHVCITSYQLVLHDHQSFRRKKWRYMILDEAHNIKNFKSQRWTSLLNFNTDHRLLLTGTPLQNNIGELWSLLYFLMPSSKGNLSMPEGFANLQDFQQWFGKPVNRLIESENDSSTKEIVNKLHQILRPYLLRRLKADVEKQMPAKYEHVVYCRLSKRQRFLYDDFMSRAKTKETLSSGNFLSIINCLMQLRKVCNHPDLFEVRPVITSFAIDKSVVSDFESDEYFIRKNLTKSQDRFRLNLSSMNFVFTENEDFNTFSCESKKRLNASKFLKEECDNLNKLLIEPVKPNYNNIQKYYKYQKYVENQSMLDHMKQLLYTNEFRCNRKPVFGKNLINLLTINRKKQYEIIQSEFLLSECYKELVKTIRKRTELLKDIIDNFCFVTPPVVALDIPSRIIPSPIREHVISLKMTNPYHSIQTNLSIGFPHKSLLQYDCGKLQKLAGLLQELKDNGHRALIFTQMTKVLDILEKFLNSFGYLYMRLDGATKIEDRQLLTERFNNDPRITVFILSTRSGGLGINLTGADTVIFYDSDWNPAMDKQCQDRCHRIGQTRDVHIYRLVSEFTIEENIIRKSNFKQKLDNVVIQKGDFTTDYFNKLTISELIGTANGLKNVDNIEEIDQKNLIASLAMAEDAEDANAAQEAIKENEMDSHDFDDFGSRSTTPVASSNPQTPQYESDDFGHIDNYMLKFIEEGYYY